MARAKQLTAQPECICRFDLFRKPILRNEIGYFLLMRIFTYLFVGLSLFITLKNSYNIFPKNYNFLEKYTSLCYTTSILTYGENT